MFIGRVVISWAIADTPTQILTLHNLFGLSDQFVDLPNVAPTFPKAEFAIFDISFQFNQGIFECWAEVVGKHFQSESFCLRDLGVFRWDGT